MVGGGEAEIDGAELEERRGVEDGDVVREGEIDIQLAEIIVE